MGTLLHLLDAAPHAHWRAGWGLILLGFLSGAALGLRFHQEGMAGGYASLRRRLMRLGHIALVALGMLNLLLALGPEASRTTWSSSLLIAGSLAMPLVCFLTAWRPAFRHLFALPVALLVGAATLIVTGGLA
jgi:hypothetical protein